MPFLIFVILIGFMIYRKANSAAQNPAQQNGRPATPERQQAAAENKADGRAYQGVNRPGAEGYAAARPMNSARTPDQRSAAQNPAQKERKAEEKMSRAGQTDGSLRFASREGFGSAEGTAGTEGECIEENPQHCAVEHLPDDAYDEVTDFGDEFDRKALLRAMIMGEVLNAPKWKTN